ncbi:MAG: DUF1874 domain-containing protein [Thermodesulfovibrio sp.]|nr:DUF1874 domain-containing protein [Thermodesulfovibrio sp.]
MFYLLNDFSPNILLHSISTVNFVRLTQAEAKKLYENIKSKEQVKNAIEHEGTVKLVSEILEALSKGDCGIIFTLSFRPERGRSL